jgi:hypothetical protein
VPLPLRFWNGICSRFSGYSYAYRFHGNRTLGIESGLFVGLACFIAYLASANRYLPFPKGPKHLLYQKLKEGN